MGTSYLVGRLVGAAVMSSSRPVTTVFAVQCLIAWLVRVQGYALPDELLWTVSFLALGIGACATVIEWLVHHTEGADELLRAFHVDRIVGALLTVPSAMLLLLLTGVGDATMERAVEVLVSEGVPQETAISWVEQAAVEAGRQVDERVPVTERVGTAEEADLLRAAQLLAESERSPVEQGLLFGLALAINLALTWLRGEVKEIAESMSLEKVWTWVESGGVAVGVASMLFFPPLLFALSIGIVAAMGGALAALWVGALTADRLARVPCPACGAQIRQEASVCPSCRAEITPAVLMSHAVDA
jgi:hypothetical protein